MLTERMQRRVDRLLDEAEESADAKDWPNVRDLCNEVLGLDPDNADAPALLRASDRVGGAGESSPASTQISTEPTNDPPAPSQPSSFVAGRYRVERFLGEGGRKRVFLAHDTTLDRDVAFAQIRTEGLDDLARERVMREAQSMARLGSHPNLVAIHDIGEENGHPHLVEEYMAGGTVASLLEDGPPDVERTLAVATDVCRALSFMHGQGLIHRDLKPANIFLTEDGVAKVGDFGLAVALDRSRITQQGSLVGTAAYMPPEQALGGEVTPQSDLYALGAMLYELVTGRPPFAGDDPTAIISQHINTPPVAPSWHTEACPPSLEALILKMLQKDPSERPESADEVLRALSQVDPTEQSKSHGDSNVLDRLAAGVFVGREDELGKLRSAFDEAFAGRGSVAMVTGEPGIGKTRTVMELETYARMRGGQVLWGRAHETSGAPAYWPWVQAIRSHVAVIDDERLRSELGSAALEVARVVSEVRERLPDLPAAPETIDAESSQFRLFDALSTFLRNASSGKPLVIVLDDLHWADKATLLLLQHVAREIGRSRLLIVGTYRHTDLDRQHPLSAALAEMNRDQLFKRIHLGPLSRAQVDSYIRSTSSVEPSRAVMERVYTETEGNPFFLSQVVALLAQQGTLAADSMSDIALPEGVTQALGQRLDRLSKECNELLGLAAVSGREFSHELLAATMEYDGDTLLRLVEEALAGRVIEEIGQLGEYRFSHALMQETLLNELSTARRVRVHARIAGSLEELWGDQSDKHAPVLAHHFSESSLLNPDHKVKAVHYGLKAAERAERELAWGEAALLYSRCIEFTAGPEDSSEEDRVELLLGLGRCSAFAGNLQTSWDAFMEAIVEYRRRGDGIGAARATLASSQFGSAIERDRLKAEALELLGQRDDHLRARLLLTGSYFQTPQADIEEARRLANGKGYADVEAGLADFAVHRALYDCRFDEVPPLARVASEMAHRVGNIQNAAHLLLDRQEAFVFQGDLSRAEEAGQETLEYARENRIRLHEEDAAAALATFGEGRCTESPYEALLTLAPRVSRRAAEVLAGRSERLGKPQEAREILDRLNISFKTGQYTEDRATGSGARSSYYLGEHARAGELLAAWGEAFLGTDFSLAAIESLTVDDVLVAIGDDSLVRDVYQKMQSWGTIRRNQFSSRSFDRMKGTLALRLGFVDAAEAHILEGLEWCESVGYPVETGRCHQALADVRARRGDVQEAMRCLDLAAGLFQQHGAKLYLDQVIAKKLELQGVGSGDTLTSIDTIAAAVQTEHPDLAPQAAPDGTVTLMFSDIIDSTATNERLGDAAWMALLHEHNAVVRDHVAANNGYEVKSMGDGFMLAFKSARDGLNCAIGIQRGIASRNESADEPVEVRIGLHTGEAVQEQGDFFGKHVNLAARIGGSATGGEILVSSLLAQIVAPSGEFTLSERPAMSLKGLDGEHVTHGVEWR